MDVWRRLAGRRILSGLLVAIASIVAPAAAQAQTLEVYKSPYCGCCAAWVDHMRAAGFEVSVSEREDLSPVKERLGVPVALRSCHTAVIDGYVIEGHVPADQVKRLLAERPAIVGLAVPGMPIGSPGMEYGDMKDPYAVILFSPTGRSVFSKH